MSYRSSTINISGGSPGSFTTLTVTGVASFADGTAAAPSVKIGDEQNGLYSSAANTLDVSCGGFQQFQFAYTANAANYWAATGAISTGGVRIDTAGVDSGVNGYFVTKGSGVWNFCTGSSSGTRQYQILHTAGSTRWVTATGSNGGSPTIGTSAGDLSFAPGGSESLRASVVASAVNYLSVAGGAAGNPIGMTAAGSDTNVAMQLSGKGSGTVYMVVRGAASFESTNPASAVNYFQVSGSATGSAVSASAAGADTNIDIAITPKGTGVLRYGTHSALAAETVTGYITIKDAAGNSRKLAVIS